MEKQHGMFEIYNNLTVLETQKEQMTYYKVIRTNWIAGCGNDIESYIHYRNIKLTKWISLVITTKIRIIRMHKLTIPSS